MNDGLVSRRIKPKKKNLNCKRKQRDILDIYILGLESITKQETPEKAYSWMKQRMEEKKTITKFLETVKAEKPSILRSYTLK